MKINQFAKFFLDQNLKSNHKRIEFKLSNSEEAISQIQFNYDDKNQSAQKLENIKIKCEYQNCSINSCSQLAIFNDQILVAKKDSILFFDRDFDYFSQENHFSNSPNKEYKLNFGDIISLYAIQKQLIVRTEKNILIFQTYQQNFILSKAFSYPNILQLNFEINQLFLCLDDQLVIIDLISYQHSVILRDKQIQAGFYTEKEYYYIIKNSNILKNSQKEYQLDLSAQIKIKSFFIIKNLLCICGYHAINKLNIEESSYCAEIFWFDLKKQNFIQKIQSLKIDLINDVNSQGDFGIQIIDELCITYGSNLSSIIFWNLEFLSLLNDNYDKIRFEICKTQNIKGLSLVNRNQYQRIKKSQESFSSTDEYPIIIIIDNQGFLNAYEIINEQDFSSDLLHQSNYYSNYEDIQFTVVQNDPREIINLANPPFNLQLITKVDDSQIVFGSGKIDHIFHLHQNWISSANLAINYKHFQIIGHEREILILKPLIIQQILLDLPHQCQSYQITTYPCELIYGLYQFQDQILIQTNSSLYLCNYFHDQWISKKILNKNSIKRVSILEDYILVKIKTYTDQFLLYQYKNDDLQQITTHSCDASCLFKLNNKITLLQILDNQLFILKDFENKECIQTDIEIVYSKEYYIKQLHENHLYVSFATLDQDSFEHYILFYEPNRKQAKQEKHLNDLLQNVRCNHLLTKITESDWNISTIITPEAKFIVIFPNGIQDGLILQVCNQDLRTIDDQEGHPIQLPSFSHIIKGVSVLNYVLPLEENLGSKPGFYKMKKDEKEFQYQCQPSILIYEFDEKGQLTIHRFLIIKLYDIRAQQPILNIQFDNQQSEQYQNTFKISRTESLVSLQPPPSPSLKYQINLSQAALITQQLVDLCQQSLLQFHQKYEHNQFIPVFPIFTSQYLLDDLFSQYYQIQNEKFTIRKQIKDQSILKQYYSLKHQFKIPKIQLKYSIIQDKFYQLLELKQHFLMICNFVKESLYFSKQQVKFNKNIINEFQYYDYKNTNKNKRQGRKILFNEEFQHIEILNSKDQFIQQLCSNPKSRVKYLVLEYFQQQRYDLVQIQNEPQILQEQKNQRISYVTSSEQEISILEQSKTESMNFGFATQSLRNSNNLENENIISQDQQLFQPFGSPSKNPFDSETLSNFHNNQLIESIIFDNKEAKSQQDLLNNLDSHLKKPHSQCQSQQKIENLQSNEFEISDMQFQKNQFIFTNQNIQNPVDDFITSQSLKTPNFYVNNINPQIFQEQQIQNSKIFLNYKKQQKQIDIFNFDKDTFKN
ncbi:unnamed protein product [Paramecium sonneborni]|uniref:Uncharacterized protein n=1 Tax=Paramecium sonneborni TaxID=65129 RepID=A0A8S1LNC9_9CILI|nr:unnamed protein product [Paramecium sonneborni]